MTNMNMMTACQVKNKTLENSAHFFSRRLRDLSTLLKRLYLPPGSVSPPRKTLQPSTSSGRSPNRKSDATYSVAPAGFLIKLLDELIFLRTGAQWLPCVGSEHIPLFSQARQSRRPHHPAHNDTVDSPFRNTGWHGHKSSIAGRLKLQSIQQSSGNLTSPATLVGMIMHCLLTNM